MVHLKTRLCIAQDLPILDRLKLARDPFLEVSVFVANFSVRTFDVKPSRCHSSATGVSRHARIQAFVTQLKGFFFKMKTNVPFLFLPLAVVAISTSCPGVGTNDAALTSA